MGKEKEKHPKCIVCGKAVKWGVDGCPIVKKGNEMAAMLGSNEGYIHYKCDEK